MLSRLLIKFFKRNQQMNELKNADCWHFWSMKNSLFSLMSTPLKEYLERILMSNSNYVMLISSMVMKNMKIAWNISPVPAAFRLFHSYCCNPKHKINSKITLKQQNSMWTYSRNSPRQKIMQIFSSMRSLLRFPQKKEKSKNKLESLQQNMERTPSSRIKAENSCITLDHCWDAFMNVRHKLNSKEDSKH